MRWQSWKVGTHVLPEKSLQFAAAPSTASFPWTGPSVLQQIGRSFLWRRPIQIEWSIQSRGGSVPGIPKRVTGYLFLLLVDYECTRQFQSTGSFSLHPHNSNLFLPRLHKLLLKLDANQFMNRLAMAEGMENSGRWCRLRVCVWGKLIKSFV